VAPSTTGIDISHDGRWIAAFQRKANGTALNVLDRNGVTIRAVAELSGGNDYATPRWSPDDLSVAFVADEGGLRHVLYLVDAAGGTPKELARANTIGGVTWLPDGSSLVYASSEGSTMPYPPILNLRLVSRHGAGDRQLTFGDASYMHPEIVQPGRVFASRVRMQSDLWAFPVAGPPSENVRNGTRITCRPGKCRRLPRARMGKRSRTCPTVAGTATCG